MSGMTNGGDRYRADGGAPTDGELRVAGPRVQHAIGRTEVTVAWSRNIRYSSKKRGYHGGASPLEVVIPLAILVHQSTKELPPGWSEAAPSPYFPDWWRLAIEQAPVREIIITPATEKVTADLPLFTQPAAKKQTSDWIEALLDGEIYEEQCKLAARGAHDRKRASQFLESLASRGGTIQREALAERLGLPLFRLNGIVADLARIFNVDGYDVVTLDTFSGTVKLDFKILKKQFELTE